METIEKAKYEGYIWYSDSAKPEIFKREIERELNLNDTENPFIIEGQLYCEEKKLSVSIKYVDGKHIVNKFNLSEEPETTDQEYLAEFRNDAGLKFRQLWKPESDPLCENFEVLKPAGFVFIGFKNKEE